MLRAERSSTRRGLYSNAARGKGRRAPHSGDTSQVAETTASTGNRTRRRSISWARLLRKVYEIDPLLCSYCGGEVRIVAFVTKLSSIRRLLAGIQAEPQEPEPLAHSPPAPELVYEPA